MLNNKIHCAFYVTKQLTSTNQLCFFFLYSHLSTVLGNKFDHGAEAIVPTLFNLVPNSAKVMATSGCAAIRFIIRVGVLL